MEDRKQEVKAEEGESSNGLNVAFVGCTHGELDTIYTTIAEIEKVQQTKIELLLCCGDFEAVRNSYDLDCLAGPAKYHFFKDFYKYYNGEALAPILTIFIGGNHEAANHLRELYYGGWVAPNIYFLGYSGVLRFGGLRFGGFSGIFKGYDFRKGHYEIPPYSPSDVRSCFHVREYELYKLSLISEPLDIIMSHDWPEGVVEHGDCAKLLRSKPHFREEIERHSLGCVQYMKLMNTLKPPYWLSGHMHCHFEAHIPHGGGSSTHFIALDKVLPRRHYLQVLNFPDKKGSRTLEYDPEWLAILRAVHKDFSLSPNQVPMPRMKTTELEKEATLLKERLAEKGTTLAVPHNFAMTVEPHLSPPAIPEKPTRLQPGQFKVSAQTEAFLEFIGLSDPLSDQEAVSRAAHHQDVNGNTKRKYREDGGRGYVSGRPSARGGRESSGGRARYGDRSHRDSDRRDSDRYSSNSSRSGGSSGSRGRGGGGNTRQGDTRPPNQERRERNKRL